MALRADDALKEARAVDAGFRRGAAVGRLAGIPFLVKESEHVAGMRTSRGSVLFADSPPAIRDELEVARLRAAGAIVVGKTNVPEFSTEGYTSNLLFGTTFNPWGTEWSPGGSSGGSAAALAAGMVPIATGTDGGGSIRIPSALCGLVGLKPTNGVIGRQPIPDWIDLITAGPMATTVADLRLLLEIESGPAAGDPAAPPRLSVDSPKTPGRFLAIERLIPRGSVDGATARLFEAALETAAEVFHCEIQTVDSHQLWPAGMPDDDLYDLATTEHVHSLGRDFVRTNLDRMHPAARAFMEHGLTVTLGDYLAARRRRFAHVERIDQLLGGDAVVLSPTLQVPGFAPDGRLYPGAEPAPLPSGTFSTGIANLTGCPAITVPAGFSPNGLPFGLQILAPRFEDGMLLNLAARWEAARPWPRVAPSYDSFEVGLGLSL